MSILDEAGAAVNGARLKDYGHPLSMREIKDRVRVTDSGCWEWVGARTGGYGVARRKGVSHRVHRLMYALATGVHPGPLAVCHRCDNPPCCNPAHLFLGTAEDNMRDAWEKGRMPLPRNAPVGMRHHSRRLTPDNVREIRRAYANGEASQPVLAERFGIHQASVWAVIHRKSWRSVA